MQDYHSLQYREKDQVSKDFKKYCKANDLVDHIYPLLDPNMKNDKERLEKHQDWFKWINKSSTFLTSEGNYADTEEFQNTDIKELGLKAPCILTFMPTKKVWGLLIRRATQMKDPISELNPKESKHKNDPVDGETQKDKISYIAGQVVRTGDDEAFNKKRVFPPESLNYPEFIRDGPDFYKRLG